MAKRPRPSGAEAPDAAMAEIRARAREGGIDAITALRGLARQAESESVRLAAIKELLDRGFGRAAAAPSEGHGGVTAHLIVDDGYAG